VLFFTLWPTHAYSQIGGTIICAEINGDTIIVAADSRASILARNNEHMGYIGSFPKFFPFGNGIIGSAGNDFWKGRSIELIIKDFLTEQPNKTDFSDLVSKFRDYLDKNYPIPDTLQKYQQLLFAGYVKERALIFMLDRTPSIRSKDLETTYKGNMSTERQQFIRYFNAHIHDQPLHTSLDVAAFYEKMIKAYALAINDTVRIGGPVSLALLIKPSRNADKPNICWIKNNLLRHSCGTEKQYIQKLESGKVKIVPLFPYSKALILQTIKNWPSSAL